MQDSNHAESTLMQVLYDEHAAALWRYAVRLTGDRAETGQLVGCKRHQTDMRRRRKGIQLFTGLVHRFAEVFKVHTHTKSLVLNVITGRKGAQHSIDAGFDQCHRSGHERADTRCD